MSTHPAAQDAEHRSVSNAAWLLIRKVVLPAAACSARSEQPLGKASALQESCISR